MIINWVATKAQLFLPEQDDELNVGFDFALSPEIMNLLYAQNDRSMDAGDREAIAETGQQEAEDANATFVTRFVLDEHELALA
ncbi:hypothetical protein [Methylobacter sp.]|uniref:hypothetical protein n=1 Tax=Methylobacter sp. TaxID=2051955 RepID=UPI002FDD4127